MRFIAAIGLFALTAFAQGTADGSDPTSTGSPDSGAADPDLYYPCYDETGYGVPYCCDNGATTASGCDERKFFVP